MQALRVSYLVLGSCLLSSVLGSLQLVCLRVGDLSLLLQSVVGLSKCCMLWSALQGAALHAAGTPESGSSSTQALQLPMIRSALLLMFTSRILLCGRSGSSPRFAVLTTSTARPGETAPTDSKHYKCSHMLSWYSSLPSLPPCPLSFSCSFCSMLSKHMLHLFGPTS